MGINIIKLHGTASSTAFLASGRKGFYNRCMILNCTSCHARYLISAQLFAAGPRQVRCARCSHEWQAELPKEIDAVGAPPDIDLTPAPEAVEPIPPGSNLPVVQKQPLSPFMGSLLLIGIPVILLVLLLVGLILGRYWIVEKMPRLEGIYGAIGLSVYHEGEGLSFIGVRSELRYEGGKMLLEVDGKIHNGSPAVETIPDIRAVAAGVDGKTVATWQIAAPATKVFPNEEQDFHSSIDAPGDAVSEVNLSFIETKKQ